MATDGETVDNPKVVNLVTPVKIQVINGMAIDMVRFAEVAEQLGANAYDTLSIQGYVNAKGELVPVYESIRIEKRSTE